MRKVMIVWVVGLATAVPYASYYLFFVASKDQYAALITFVLFWLFGYWGVVGPLVTVTKVWAFLRALERARSKDEFLAIIASPDGRAAAIDLIANENRVPRFVAAWVYRVLVRRITTAAVAAPPPQAP